MALFSIKINKKIARYLILATRKEQTSKQKQNSVMNGKVISLNLILDITETLTTSQSKLSSLSLSPIKQWMKKIENYLLLAPLIGRLVIIFNWSLKRKTSSLLVNVST